MGGLWALLVLALVGPAASSPAAAQPRAVVCVRAPSPPVPDLRIGTCWRSELGAGDSQVEPGIFYEDYRLHLDQGESVRISMTAAAPRRLDPRAQVTEEALSVFDPLLEVRSAADGAIVQTADDGPRSLSPTMVFTAPATGDYSIRARTVGPGSGAYELAVEAAIPPRPPIDLLGPVVEATLTSQNPRSDVTAGYRSAYYAFEAGAEERVRLELTSDTARPMMWLHEPPGPVLALSVTNGDNGAEIVAVLHQGGRYVVRVDAAVEDRPTHYALRLARASAAAEQPPVELRYYQPLQGVLALDAAVSLSEWSLQPDFFYRLYGLQVRAGDPVTVDLEANGFDPVLDAGGMSIFGFGAALTDDDSGPGLNSRLVLRPQQSGMVYLRVRSQGLRFGTFSLRASSGALPREP